MRSMNAIRGMLALLGTVILLCALSAGAAAKTLVPTCIKRRYYA